MMPAQICAMCNMLHINPIQRAEHRCKLPVNKLSVCVGVFAPQGNSTYDVDVEVICTYIFDRAML